MHHLVALVLFVAALASPCSSQSIHVRDCYFGGLLSVQVVNGEPLVYLISTGGWVASWIGGSQQGPRTWGNRPGVQLLPLRTWTFNSQPCMVGHRLFALSSHFDHHGVLATFDHLGWQEHPAQVQAMPPGYADIEYVEPGTCEVFASGGFGSVGACGLPCGPGMVQPDILVIEARVRFN